MGLLDGKVIALTGAGRGIGREVALLAASEGAKIVVNDAGVNPDGSGHDGGPADQVAAEIKAAGGEAVSNTADISTMDGGESVVQQALDVYGQLDGLVNLAAILRDRMIFNMTEEEWDTVVNVDLKGHFTTIKPASVVMRQQRYGRIINFSSVSGLQGNPGQANYGAAKAGIGGLTRVVARDMGRYGVTCNAIAPGAMTRLTLAVPADTAKKRAAAGIGTPGAEADPEEVARQREAALEERGPDRIAPMVVYLLLDEAWNINGHTFAVAGGDIGLLPFLYPPIRNIHKEGRWSLGELQQLVPSQLMSGIENPAPPRPDIDVPGRGVVSG
jgi:NAD(P)-dependent dehydrogenase (short-subunit alcohol dehydrogenase family)